MWRAVRGTGQRPVLAELVVPGVLIKKVHERAEPHGGLVELEEPLGDFGGGFHAEARKVRKP